MAKWFRFVEVAYSLWQLFAGPAVGGVTLVVGIVMNASTGFYVAVVCMVALWVMVFLGASYFKWKRWDKYQYEAEGIIGEIILIIKRIFKYTEEKAIELSRNEANLHSTSAFEGKTLDAISSKNHQEIQKKQSKRLDFAMDLDNTHGKTMYDELVVDAGYKMLSNELDKQRAMLKGSTELVSKLIDDTVNDFIYSNSVMIYKIICDENKQYIGDMIPQTIKDKFARNERKKDSQVNQRLEKLRTSIRREIMRIV